MGEPVFDLDLNIDDKFWSNFSSHPSRDPSIFAQTSARKTNVEKEIKEEEPISQKTAEQIIQSNTPLDQKMTALFQGDFKIDKETKPTYHLLMDFEDKEGVPLILAKPSFTQKDVEKYFQSLEKPKTVPPPVVVIVPTQPALNQSGAEDVDRVREQNVSRVTTPEEEHREYNESPRESNYNRYNETEVSQRRSDEQHEDGVLNTRVIGNIPDSELEARSLHVSRRYEEEPVLQKQENSQSIVEEGRVNEVPVSGIPDRRIEESFIEVPRKRVRLDGQILGNSLLRNISFDSFHYVKFQPWRQEPSFLFDRFVKRTQFTKYLGEINARHGSNHLIRSYFNEGILKSPYLVERYFRNPFIYNN